MTPWLNSGMVICPHDDFLRHKEKNFVQFPLARALADLAFLRS